MGSRWQVQGDKERIQHALIPETFPCRWMTGQGLGKPVYLVKVKVFETCWILLRSLTQTRHPELVYMERRPYGVSVVIAVEIIM